MGSFPHRWRQRFMRVVLRWLRLGITLAGREVQLRKVSPRYVAECRLVAQKYSLSGQALKSIRRFCHLQIQQQFTGTSLQPLSAGWLLPFTSRRLQNCTKTAYSFLFPSRVKYLSVTILGCFVRPMSINSTAALDPAILK